MNIERLCELEWWRQQKSVNAGFLLIVQSCYVLIYEFKLPSIWFIQSSVFLLFFRVFEKSLQYVKRFSRYKNPDAVRQVREYPPIHMFFGFLFLFVHGGA